MRISSIFSLFLVSALFVSCSGSSDTLVYKDANAPIEKRIDDLMSRMTLEEKIYQASQQLLGENDNDNNFESMNTVDLDPRAGSVIYSGDDPVHRNAFQKKAVEETRLGIPVIFGHDIIHGFRTIYPIPLAMGCTWNPDLLTQCTGVAAQESRQSGIDWTFAPMIDVARDPRWGRISEGYGEDPYTASVFAVAGVKGFQGDDLTSDHNIASCLKHYVGYGASEAGRDYVYSEISKQTLWDTYLPPYEAAVKAGAQTLMSAFNDISGVPASANHYTMTDILRDKWNFDGFVVSDWGAIEQLINQGYASDISDAASKAISAGVDMDMTDGIYIRTMQKLIVDGKLSEKVLDEAVRRILRVKFRLGLFEKPYVKETPDSTRLLLPTSLAIAENAAEESMVLLKNDDNILPLNANVKNIALIGPMVKDQEDMLGNWNGYGHASDVTTIYDAFVKEFPSAKISYAAGCSHDGEDRSGFAEALRVAKSADVVFVCLGEKNLWSGENGSRATILLPQVQRDLLTAISKCGKPVILTLNNGRPLELTAMEPEATAILEMWQPGVTGGTAAAAIVSGRVNPSGKLCATFPYSATQIPIYYNRRNPARTPTQGYYQDMTVEPLYPFGYGLSYTTFNYSELKISTDKVAQNGTMTASIDVTNTGKVAGKETVHWFISDPACSVVTRPMKELRYFEKAELQPGETRTFTFNIDVARDFSYINDEGNRFVEPGDIYIEVNGQREKVVVE